MRDTQQRSPGLFEEGTNRRGLLANLFLRPAPDRVEIDRPRREGRKFGFAFLMGAVLDLALERDHQVANVGAHGRIPFGRRDVAGAMEVAAPNATVARHGRRVVGARTLSRSAWPYLSWRADVQEENLVERRL